MVGPLLEVFCQLDTVLLSLAIDRYISNEIRVYILIAILCLLQAWNSQNIERTRRSTFPFVFSSHADALHFQKLKSHQETEVQFQCKRLTHYEFSWALASIVYDPFLPPLGSICLQIFSLFSLLVFFVKPEYQSVSICIYWDFWSGHEWEAHCLDSYFFDLD
jgi:hypothetical protein